MSWRDHLTCLVLVLLTWIVYFQVLDFEFVDYDDRAYVFENPHVLTGLTAENIRWLLHEDGRAGNGSWHPLTWLSLMLDAQIFGTSPRGFHLTNVLFHTANVLLLFAVLRQMTGAVWMSAFVAGLFGVHPLHVESVAWVSERKDVLSTFFGLISLWAYTRYARRPAGSWYLVASVAFVLSLLSKQMLVTMPCLFLLLDWWPLRRVGKYSSAERLNARSAGATNPAFEGEGPIGLSCPQRTWGQLCVEKVPFLLITVAFCVVAVRAQQLGKALITLEQFPIGRRAGTIIINYADYLTKAVWPQYLACFYPHQSSLPRLDVAISAVVLIFVTGISIVYRRSRPYLLVGWFWFLGTLVPVIGIVEKGSLRIADRFTYFPIVGLFIAVTWLVANLMSSRPLRQRTLSWVAAVVLLLLTATAYVQTASWRDTISLWAHAAAVTEQNDLAHYNLGNIAYDAGRFDEAIAQFEITLGFLPQDPAVHNALGLALAQNGRFEAAIEHFQDSLNFDPNNASVHTNLRRALYEIGGSQHTIDHFDQALQVDPTNALAYYNLGILMLEQGKQDAASRYFQDAVRLKPDFHEAQKKLRPASQN